MPPRYSTYSYSMLYTFTSYVLTVQSMVIVSIHLSIYLSIYIYIYHRHGKGVGKKTMRFGTFVVARGSGMDAGIFADEQRWFKYTCMMVFPLENRAENHDIT